MINKWNGSGHCTVVKIVWFNRIYSYIHQKRKNKNHLWMFINASVWQLHINSRFYTSFSRQSDGCQCCRTKWVTWLRFCRDLSGGTRRLGHCTETSDTGTVNSVVQSLTVRQKLQSYRGECRDRLQLYRDDWVVRHRDSSCTEMNGVEQRLQLYRDECRDTVVQRWVVRHRDSSCTEMSGETQTPAVQIWVVWHRDFSRTEHVMVRHRDFRLKN